MLKGRCLCGAIRFEVTGPVEDVGNCHCSMCRRSHGTPFASFARVANADLSLLAGEDAVRRYRSSEVIERSFCGTCGARFTFRFDGMPDHTWIAAGLFDDDPALRPDHHIFVGSKASWDEILDDLPRHDAYPPLPGAE